MNIKKYYAVVLFVLAISVGLNTDSLMAQQSYSGQGHSGSCAGGCSHGGGGDSLELIPYGPAGQAAMRQSYQQRRMPPSYGHRDAMGGGMNYAQRYQSSSPYRAAYQGSFSPRNDRGSRENYQMRREDFTYANDPAAGSSSRGTRGHGGCRGGCPHVHRGAGAYNSRSYEGDGQPAFGGGGQFRDEADQAPQLNRYPTRRDNQSASSGRSRSSQSLNPRSFQMRQEYANPQLQGGIGSTSDEMFSPSGPPPTSLGMPGVSNNSGCDHAGCNHEHN